MTTTAAPPYYVCTLPTVWPDPFLTGTVRSKARPAPVCFLEFDSPAGRRAHQEQAHPDYLADLARGAELRAHHGGPRQVVSEAYAEPPAREDGARPSVTGPVEDAASPKQLAFIVSLAERKGVEPNEVRTREEASAEIDRLNALPNLESFRRNRHPGKCSDCGHVVEAEAGVIRQVDGRWLVGHLDGCPETPALPLAVPDGTYAVTADAGNVSFYKVTAGRKPGVVFMDQLIAAGGRDLSSQKVPFQQVDAILAKITAAGFEAAALRFRQEAGRCARCGRALSNKVSLAQAYGPECIRKV